MKKFIIKATTLAGVGTLLVTGALPVNAEDTTSDGTTKDESVYVVLNADGSVSNVTVSDQLHNANGFSNYQDKSDLKDVQNLKSDDPVQSSSDGYKWTTTDTDIYYQGKTTKALPLDTTIEYKLDGKTVDPKDIVGKSGHLSMTFNIKNTQTKQYTIDGKTYTVCQPFYVAAGGMLDQDHFTNVKIDHGTVSTDTSHSIALAVMMPGMKDSIGQFLTGDLSSLNDYLFDTITIEADVTDFESPTMMMAASTDLSALKGELKDDGAFDTTDLFDQLDKLDDATKQLIDGASALYDGADQLASGAKDLDTGAGTLNDGAQSLLDGIASLNNGTATLVSGASQVNAGASALASGLNTLNSNSATLNAGAQTIADGILKTVNDSLKAQGLDEVTWTNYADKIGEYQGVTDSMRQQAFDDVKTQINAAAAKQGVTLTDDQVKLALYMAYKNNTDNSFSAAYLTTNLPTVLGQMQNAAAVQQKFAKYSTDDAIASAKSALTEATYTELVQKVEKSANLDETSAKQILTYAMLHDYDKTSTNPTAAISSAVTKAAGEAQTAQAVANATTQSAVVKNMTAMDTAQAQWFEQSVQAVMASKVDQATASGIVSYAWSIYDASKGADGWQDALDQAGKDVSAAAAFKKNYADAADAATQTAVKASIADTVYNSIVASVEATGKDETTAKAAITYAVNVYLKSENYDITKALNDVANDSDQALNVQSAQKSLGTEEGQQILKSAENTLVKGSDGFGDLQTAKDTLDGVAKFVAGLKEYTDGVASAAAGAQKLAEGTDQLNAGAEQLQSGASQLQTGAQSLKNGTQSLKDGTSKLSSGADSLKDGAGKLKDGLQQYNDEGISKP
ncbi:MAG: hypothetical protein U0K47_07470, partial [Erysipelotrichaceae bacterium]|nr:hypothetical protein [Erysipelotrichaceae bacterium]